MGKDPSEIRREIEETRARLGDTVEALAYKTDVPARVKDNAAEKLETVRGTVGDVAGTVKDAAGAAKDAAGTAKDAAAGAAATLKDTVAGAAGTVKNAVGGASEAVKGAAGGVAQAVSNVGARLPEPADVADAARRGSGIIAQNPLGLALGGLASGSWPVCCCPSATTSAAPSGRFATISSIARRPSAAMRSRTAAPRCKRRRKRRWRPRSAPSKSTAIRC